MFFRPSRSARGTGSRCICRATSRFPTTRITPCLETSKAERMKAVRKRVLIVLLVASLCVGTAFAQFGGVVYDPTNYSNALLRYFQLQQHLAQLQKTYTQIVTAYNLALQMSRNLHNMPARYRAQFSNWRNVTANNTYGNTADWLGAVNADLNVVNGYL